MIFSWLYTTPSKVRAVYISSYSLALSKISLVHRTLAGKGRVLHRDINIFSIMVYQRLGHGADQRKYYLQDCPPLIDEVMMGKARSVLDCYLMVAQLTWSTFRTPEERRARCLLIDYDNSAKLTAGQANAVDQTTLRCRTVSVLLPVPPCSCV